MLLLLLLHTVLLLVLLLMCKLPKAWQMCGHCFVVLLCTAVVRTAAAVATEATLTTTRAW
jgi:hypothetical protein